MVKDPEYALLKARGTKKLLATEGHSPASHREGNGLIPGFVVSLLGEFYLLYLPQ